MKKKILALIVLTTSFVIGFGKTITESSEIKEKQIASNKIIFIYNPDTDLNQIQYGLIDSNEKIIIKPEYDGIYIFERNDLIPIKVNDKWGFVDMDGNIKVEAQFDDVSLFKEGFAIVEKDNKYGIINNKGSVVADPIYDFINNIKEEPLNINFVENKMPIQKDEKWAYINKEGKIVIDFQYDMVDKFSEGLGLIAKYTDEFGYKYGYIDKDGKTVIEPQYKSASNFNEGLAVVSKDEKYGYIDKDGKVVIDFKYDDAYKFTEGLAAVSKDEKYGYIDKDGKAIIDFKYDDAASFVGGLGVLTKGKKSIIIDKNGNIKNANELEFQDLDIYKNIDLDAKYLLLEKDYEYKIMNIKTGEINDIYKK